MNFLKEMDVDDDETDFLSTLNGLLQHEGFGGIESVINGRQLQ